MNPYLFSIFILFCIFCSLLAISERRNFIVLDILLAAFYVLLIASRSEDTPDTLGYIIELDSINTDHFYTFGNVDTIYRYEYGYTLISQIFKMVLGNNYVLFFGLIAIINLVIVYIFSKKILEYKNNEKHSSLISTDEDTTASSSDLNLLFAPFFSLYVSYFGFMYSGIVLRQSLAFSIYLIAFYLLISKKYFWGILFLFICFFFHNMAIFTVGVLFFVFSQFTFEKTKYYRFLSLILLLYVFKFFNVFSTFISRFLINIFGEGFVSINSDKIFSYLGNTPEGGTQYSLSIIVNFIFTFIAIKLSDTNDKFQHKLIQINLFALSALSIMAGILALSRAIDYYSFFTILLFYLLLIHGRTNMLKFSFFCLIVLSNSILFYRLALL